MFTRRLNQMTRAPFCSLTLSLLREKTEPCFLSVFFLVPSLVLLSFETRALWYFCWCSLAKSPFGSQLWKLNFVPYHSAKTENQIDQPTQLRKRVCNSASRLKWLIKKNVERRKRHFHSHTFHRRVVVAVTVAMAVALLCRWFLLFRTFRLAVPLLLLAVILIFANARNRCLSAHNERSGRKRDSGGQRNEYIYI